MKDLVEVKAKLQGEAMDKLMDEVEFMDVDWYEFNNVLNRLFEEIEE